MFRPLPFYIGLRYTRAKRRNHFISFISIISVLGIVLGVWALIVIISVMNGFEKELHERILGMISHATISEPQGEMPNWRSALTVAQAHPEVIGAAPYVQRESMIRGYRVSGALIRGVEPQLENSVSEVGDKMLQGGLDELRSGEFGIVLGVHLAAILGAQVGDKVAVFAPMIRATPAGAIPQVKRFTVRGIFSVGMNEYDTGMALVHIEDAARLFRMDDGVTGIRLKVVDLLRARQVAGDLQAELSDLYWIRDWTEQHANLFRAIKMEKTVMFVIVSLIIAVAAFNIISTLVMVVTDKQADIAILRTLGLSAGRVMGVFVVLGSLIGIIGTATGLGIGVLTALNVEHIVPWLEQQLGMRFLSSDIYLISDLPSDMHWSDVIKIGTLSLLLTVTATLYPAWRAARTDPAEALRYE